MFIWYSREFSLCAPCTMHMESMLTLHLLVSDVISHCASIFHPLEVIYIWVPYHFVLAKRQKKADSNLFGLQANGWATLWSLNCVTKGQGYSSTVGEKRKNVNILTLSVLFLVLFYRLPQLRKTLTRPKWDELYIKLWGRIEFTAAVNLQLPRKRASQIVYLKLRFLRTETKYLSNTETAFPPNGVCLSNIINTDITHLLTCHVITI